MLQLGINKEKGFTLIELLASMALLVLITLMVFTIFNQSTKVWRKAGARTDQYIAARAVLDQMAREIRGAVMVKNFAVPGGGSTMGRMDFVVLHANGGLLGWRDSASEREQLYSDQIYFVAPVETGTQARQNYALIGYWVQDQEKDTTAGSYDSDERIYPDIDNHNDDRLYRYYVTDNRSPEWENMDFLQPGGAAGSNEFTLNVKSLRIRCWSDDDSSHFTTMWEDVTGSGAGYEHESKDSWNTQSASGNYDSNRLPKAVKITIVVQDEKNIQKEREFSIVVYLDNATR